MEEVSPTGFSVAPKLGGRLESTSSSKLQVLK